MTHAMLVTKTQLMEAVINGPAHEAFEHSTEGLFDVTEMRKWCELRPELLVTVPLRDICGFLRENRVFDQSRVDSLLAKSWKDDPGIYIDLPDGSQLIIDGIHRALRREQEGEFVMQFYRVDLKDAIRPNEGFYKSQDIGIDWGNGEIIDGKIVRR